MLTMRNLFTILLIWATLGLSACTPQHDSDPEGAVSWSSFDTGLEKARETNKKIMVHVYTDWCEYCKKLETDVYPDSSVMQTLTEYYIPVKLNADSVEYLTYKGTMYTEEEFALELGIKSYPTILFLDKNGEIILQINGYMPVYDFQSMLAYIGEEAFTRTEFHEFASQRNR
jgi:thioredoxin-related protein